MAGFLNSAHSGGTSAVYGSEAKGTTSAAYSKNNGNSNSGNRPTITAANYSTATSAAASPPSSTPIDDRGGGRSGGCCSLGCCFGRSRSGEYSPRCCRGFLCGCYIGAASRSKFWKVVTTVTKSKTWRVFMYIFWIYLLFGPALQAMIDVRELGDLIFLILRLVMLTFFVVDIIFRCFLDEDYFVLTLCKGGNDINNSSSMTPSRNSTGSGDSSDVWFGIGSFLFWCDVISTLSILYDLSFLNNHHFQCVERTIMVNDGVPTPESRRGYQFSRLALNTLEFNLIVVILRSARCARFVKSKAGMGVSKRVDWYGLYKLLRFINPCFYYNLWQIKREEARESWIDEGSGDFSILGATIGVRRRSSLDTTGVARRSSLDNYSPGGDFGSRAFASENLDSRALASQRSFADEYLASGPFETEGGALQGAEEKKGFGSGLWNKLRTSVIRLESQESDTDDEWYRDKSKSAMSVRSSRSGRSGPSDESDSTRRKSIFASFHSSRRNSTSMAPKSKFQSKSGKGNHESQVGSDMRELTGSRVAVGTLLMLLCTVFCTYTEASTTQLKTMVVLHTQTKTPEYIEPSLAAATNSSTPTLYEYIPASGSGPYYPNYRYGNGTDITERNKIKITVNDSSVDVNNTSIGWFDDTQSVKHEATVDIVATIFIIFFWFTGVISFSGPVMLLVITPVEQMVRLLNMLTLDPLGYQSTARYKKFLVDDENLCKNTRWTSEVLKGMETSFLKSTILRIGSLMKVGFGSAGVEIIQNNLEKGNNKNMLVLNSQGKTVSCIFLFSDIRQFTDATEQLQEEVFVFTNRIAAVVHSVCNSYGGAANKNVGDAFLLSWALDGGPSDPLAADDNQADKALLSVIKICIALVYDSFFLQPLSDAARGRLTSKLKDRSGSVVQMGFGLHAGKAVQGAIGSQRKIDATYVAESVERSEFLESSTKKYGLKMLMSGEFHKLLQPRTQNRCRKVDQVLILGSEDENVETSGEFMNLYTFDMNVNAMEPYYRARNSMQNDDDDVSIASSVVSSMSFRRLGMGIRNRRRAFGQRRSMSGNHDFLSGGSHHGRKSDNLFEGQTALEPFEEKMNEATKTDEFVLKSAPTMYSQNVWQSPDMIKLREKYAGTMFFSKKYRLGLEAFYKKDWEYAKGCFQDILERFTDGPSSYFLAQIEENKGIPPKDFKEYGIAYA